MNSPFEVLDSMAAVPAGPEEHHGEGSVLQHTVLVAEEMAQLNPDDPVATLMAWSHDVGKVATPSEDLPNHYDHDERGAKIISEFPDEWFSDEAKEIAMLTAEQHMRFKNLPKMRAAKVIRLVTKLDDAGITAERMRDLIVADQRGRIPQRAADATALDNCIETVRTAQSDLDESEIANQQHRLQELVRLYRDACDTKSE